MGERISVYLPDELAEELSNLENTSEFIQRAVKKELGHSVDDDVEETLTDRLDEVEDRLELLRKETTKTKIADAVVGGSGPFNRRPKRWDELKDTHAKEE